MNKLLSLLLILLVSSCSDKVTREYREQVRQGWDVVIPPIERVPDTTLSMVQAMSSSGSYVPGYLESISPEVKQAYDTAQSKRKVHVYVLDTSPGNAGRGPVHPAFEPIIGSSKIFVPGDSGRDGDSQGHGTHCMGIVAGTFPGRADIPVGVASILREGGLIELHAGQVLNDSGSGSFQWIGNGLQWVLDDSRQARAGGAFVIASMSLGANTRSTALDPILRKLKDAGIAVFAANGNTGRSPVGYPGHSPYTYGVASIDKNGNRSPFSSYGPETFFAAPGSRVYSSYKNNQWAVLNGTSMATPAEVGAFAVAASLLPEYDLEALEGLFKSHSTDLGNSGRDNYFGYGTPKLAKILKAAKRSPQDPGDDDPSDDPTDDPEDDPVEDPDPEPDPEPTPDRPDLNRSQTVTYRTKPHKIYINWKNRGEGIPDTSFWMPFVIDVELKSKSRTPEKLIEKLVTDYYTRRGLLLTGSQDMDTMFKSLYYTALFLELEGVKKRKLDMSVTRIMVYEQGTLLEGRDLPNLRESDDQEVNQMIESAFPYTIDPH